MGQTRSIQNSLNSGELSPRLGMREDYARYANGCKTLRNFQPLSTGGVITQYGQQFIAQTKDGVMAYLWEFEYSATQAYVIEATALFLRFYRDGGRIFDLSGNVSATADNGSGLIRVTTDAAHALSTGHYVSIGGVIGTDEANGEWIVTVIDATNIDLQSSTFTNTYTSGGTWNRPYQIASPYTLAQLPNVKFVQSANVMYLVHADVAPRKLTRTSHTAWTLAAVTFLDGPYDDVNTTTTTLTPAAATGSNILITASAVTGINSDTGFQTTDVGRFIRMSQGGVWGYCVITVVDSTTTVHVDIINTLTSTAAKTIWKLGAFSATGGYPSVVSIYEQRIVYCATAAAPHRLWFSTTGSYEDFSPSATAGTIAASDAMTYQLGSNKVNTIQWAVASRDLYIGTIENEFSLSGGTAALSALNPPIVRAGTTEGSNHIGAKRIGSHIIFVQRSGRELRELWYDFASEDNLVSEELSLIAEHFFRNPLSITCMTYQNKPNRTVWLVRSDGALLCFVNYVAEKVRAWSLCGSTAASGLYKWATVITSVDGLDDQAWFVVQRTIGGVTKHYVEMQDQDTSVHCGLTYAGAAAAAVTGLDHLNGETVKIVGNGAVYDDQVVVRGSVDLAYGATSGPAATPIYVGLAITPNPSMTTLEPVIKDQKGSSRYKLKHWASIAVELENTLGLTINGSTQVQYRTPADPMDSAPPAFTGTKQIANLGWDHTGTLTFEQTLPLPATILGYSGELDYGD